MPGFATQICSPVYPRFLAGGSDDLYLKPAQGLAIAAFGALMLALACPESPAAEAGWHGWILAGLTSLATGVLLAGLAARWLGRRVGFLAGMVYVSSAGLMARTLLGDASDAFFALSMAVALGAFGLGNTAGRLPMRADRGVAWTFYAAAGAAAWAAGPLGPVCILAAGLVALYLGEDPQGLRFFASPVGWVLFAAVAVLAPAIFWWNWGAAECSLWAFLMKPPGGPALSDASLPWLVRHMTDLLFPWTPLAAMAILVGLARGHSALPAWRLFAAWAAAPLLMTAAGLWGARPPVAAVLPPVAVMAAAGIHELAIWARRGGTRRTALTLGAWLGACAAVAALGGGAPLSRQALFASAGAAAVGCAAFLRMKRRGRATVRHAANGPASFVVRTHRAAQGPAPAVSANTSSTA